MAVRPGKRLRKREIAFAVTLGAFAAGGAALVLAESDGGPMPIAVTAGPQTYDVAAFEEISTVGPQHVVVTVGGAQSIRSEGSQDALGALEIVVEDGELIIRPKEQFRGGFNWSQFDSTTFFVTVPKLEAVSMAGSGNVQVDRIEGDSFAGSIAGSGELAIAEMQVDEADFSIAGSGSLMAAGTARESEITIAGSGDVEAGGLRSETGSVSIAGSGNVALTIDRDARVSIMGSGDVEISGSARCSVTRMGSGEVRCSGDDVVGSSPARKAPAPIG